ncbi:uncharacterized protein N7496_008852 [Penicillium cataractarum]|uniref:Uncharacterized protein n=1 Tax=Penicillium cataractarum TaxID=2100454 RepID=A0A9W9RZS8_9EURO|nr:uncharacterized protein N7496_008852 [Penicillium cataractarum]KAJ5369092.1 hypothetical protein N7496_008852 [Penicillium cataractarum]
MNDMEKALENEAPQVDLGINSAPISLSSIASRMSISALCETEDPLISMSAIASQMRFGGVYADSSLRESRKTPEPAAVSELSESPLTSTAPSTPTVKSDTVACHDEDEEAPRSLKRKRQPVKIFSTPSSSTRTTPAHSPDSVVPPSGSSDVSRKIRSLRIESPIADESPGRPRLRSEARKLKREAGQTEDNTRSMQAELSSLRTQVDHEKRENAKLKAQATKDKDGLKSLRAELKALRSEFASERCESSELKGQVVALRADLDLLRSEVQGDSTGDASIIPETRRDVDKILLMNDMLRRVIQGERINTQEMRSKLNSVREKVGPLMAKVDDIQEAVNELRANLTTHDAPIELIMDFVRNFHQWWVGRYHARLEARGQAGNDSAPAPAAGV